MPTKTSKEAHAGERLSDRFQLGPDLYPRCRIPQPVPPTVITIEIPEMPRSVMRFGEALESIKPVPLAEVLNPAWHKWKKSGASGGELEAMEQDVRARDCPGNPQDKYLLDTLVKIATGIEKKNYSQEPSAIYYSRMVSHLASQVQSEPSRGLAISISRWCKASLFVDTHSPRVLKQYCRDHCGQRRFRKMFPSVQEQPQRIRA